MGENIKIFIFKIQNKFKQLVDYEIFGVVFYNFFIFLYQNMDKNCIEVYLVNYGLIFKENMDLFNIQQDLLDKDKGIYYVFDQNYLFVIYLLDVELFSIMEKEVIDKLYFCFVLWV